MSKEDKNSYHHGDLRQALLDRAAEVIDEVGVEALSLRGLARDLGVSHGAPNRHFKNKAELLTRLATYAYEEINHATLSAAESAGEDTWVALNAMGRGYLKWALMHPALFRVVMNPNVSRYINESFKDSMTAFRDAVAAAVKAATDDGRLTDYDEKLVTLYTNSVPFGVAGLLLNPMFAAEFEEYDIDELVNGVIELVVPVRGRR